MVKKLIATAIESVYGMPRPQLAAAWHWETVDGPKMMPTPVLRLGTRLQYVSRT